MLSPVQNTIGGVSVCRGTESRGGLRRAPDGQSLVEFALVIPILLLVIFGIVEFGRAFMISNVLHAAAREGARVYAVGGTDSTATARIDQVLGASGIDPGERTVTITGPDANDAITVTVETDMQILTKSVVFDFPTIHLRGETVMRFEG